MTQTATRKRHFSKDSTSGEYWYDENAATDAANFFKSFLHHVKGDSAGSPFVLLPWQENEVIRPAFGWKRRDGSRKYRRVYVEIPRKNGKSTMCAGIALKLTFADGEPGAEVYCLAPETRILYADLSWRSIGDAEVGDELIGFDAHPKKPGTYRKLRRSIVQRTRRLLAPTFRLELDNGASVVCTAEHRWLARPSSQLEWRRTAELKVGHRIRWLTDAWDYDESRDGGYLSGLFDGEGYFHAPLVERAAFRIGFAQKPGLVFDEGVRLLQDRGYNPRVFEKNKHGVANVQVGGLGNVLRLLGSIRPLRFIAKNSNLWESKAPSRGGYATITAIIPAGEREVIDIETSTGTFFAEGLFSHNSAAADRDQAAIVFDVARTMVEEAPELAQQSQSYRRSIVVPSTRCSYKVLSADAYSKHGLNAHGIIFDELHAQPNRELWDVLTTSTGARRQALIVTITTAGFDRHSICWELHDYALKVRDGIIDDPTFLPVIYAAPDDADWTDPKVWRAANPSLGVTISEEYLAQECQRAQDSPAYQNTFRRLHLNQWTEQESRWIDMATYDDSEGHPIDLEAYKGKRCFAGLDLSTTTDLTARALLFRCLEEDGAYDCIMQFWVPEEAIEKRAQRDRVPYPQWEREGWIEATAGNVVDYDIIRQHLLDTAKEHQVEEIGYDPWNATQLATQLSEEGATCVPVRQGIASLTEACKELEKLILAKRFHHGGNPVLRWNFSNVIVIQDSSGNIKPAKNKSTERIDGCVAVIVALSCAIRHEGDGTSIYEQRGILVL